MMSSAYLVALGITLAVEIPVVAALYRGQRGRMAITCALATSATHLFMHFGLPRLLSPGGSVVLVGEIIALLVEAAVYAAVARPREPGRALIASALANSLSYAAGLVIF